MKWTIRLAALALAIMTVTLRAQQLVTIQAPQVAGIVNATTTRNIIVLPQGYREADFLLNITGTGAATGALNIWLQDSVDGGTTWNDLATFNTFSFGNSAIAQRLALYGGNDGPGFIRTIAGATPAAGAEVAETVPAGTRWELLSFRARFVTSATVANRFPVLTLDDGTANAFFEGGVLATAQTAGQTSRYTFAQGLNAQINQTNFTGSLMNRAFLLVGYRIKTVTSGIQVGDQWDQISYLVREWRDAPFSSPVQESIASGQVRNGPYGDRIRVREKVSAIAGSPTGPTYTITAVLR